MIKINPFTFWLSGKNVTANILYVQCNTDNLKDSAQFYWSLYDELNGNMLICGNLTMTGNDYENFNNNDFAINWVASQLKITIL